MGDVGYFPIKVKLTDTTEDCVFITYDDIPSGIVFTVLETNARYTKVFFFKPSGKWSTTETVKWVGDGTTCIFEEFKNSLIEHFKNNPNRLSDMIAICIEPIHKNAHPIQLSDWHI